MPSLNTLQRKLANSRFFTISAILHLIIVVMFGGTVLFNKYVEPADFTGDAGGLLSSEQVALPPQPEQPLMQQQQMTPQVTQPTTSVATPALAAITTSAPSQASFTIPTLVT